jgi:hypothetical protein
MNELRTSGELRVNERGRKDILISNEPGRAPTWARIWGVIAIATVFASSLISIEAIADNIGSVVSSDPACQGAANQTQKGQYCASAQSAEQGSNADSALWKVWGGVAVVCTAACSPLGVAMATGCKYSNQSAKATDSATNRQYSSALQTSLNEQGGNVSQIPGAPTSAAGKLSGKISTPCQSAIAAAATAYSKFSSMKGQDQSAQANLSSARTLDISAGTSVDSGQISAATAGASLGAANSNSANVVNGESATAASICANARKTSDPAATIQCAVANDPTLPGFVNSTEFLSDFKKASGTDFSQFGNGTGASPADAIAQAASANLDTSTATKVAMVMKSLQDKMALDVTPYSGGGSGTSVAGADANDANLPAFNDIMAGLMGKLGNPGDKTGAPSGIQAVIFANQRANKTRSPASVAENRSLSIFDRVTYRYYFVTKKMGMEGHR